MLAVSSQLYEIPLFSKHLTLFKPSDITHPYSKTRTTGPFKTQPPEPSKHFFEAFLLTVLKIIEVAPFSETVKTYPQRLPVSFYGICGRFAQNSWTPTLLESFSHIPFVHFLVVSTDVRSLQLWSVDQKHRGLSFCGIIRWSGSEDRTDDATLQVEANFPRGMASCAANGAFVALANDKKSANRRYPVRVLMDSEVEIPQWRNKVILGRYDQLHHEGANFQRKPWHNWEISCGDMWRYGENWMRY